MVINSPWYYRLVIAFAKPLYRLSLARKRAKLPYYEREINERFGYHYLPAPTGARGVIWCHAVSLGELNTAYPLLKMLLDSGFGLWITSTTQTGFARVDKLFGDELGGRVQHSFVPVDDVGVVRRFLSHTSFEMAIFIETELWANTLYLLAKNNIPSVMVNARLTQSSFVSYQKFSRLSRAMMTNLSYIIAQDDSSRDNFIALGARADKVGRAYSLKWCTQARHDLPIYHEMQTWHIKNRPIWVMASTHAGEEALALDVHQKLLADFENALLILVPRHPERFEEVATLCKGFIYHRRSCDEAIFGDTQVYLADSMGELLAWYEVAQVAVVGGSFVDKGGHNPIEPASVGTPVVMGRYVKNCADIVSDLMVVGGLIQTDDEGLYEVVKAWLTNPKSAGVAGESAKALTKQRANADKEQFELLMAVLKV